MQPNLSYVSCDKNDGATRYLAHVSIDLRGGICCLYGN
uniref:Uncharacterized protein n=1 Tax=Anguilla anguilla TaxID=7936 RepID=A0A0E9S2Y3_ANGAN